MRGSREDEKRRVSSHLQSVIILSKYILTVSIFNFKGCLSTGKAGFKSLGNIIGFVEAAFYTIGIMHLVAFACNCGLIWCLQAWIVIYFHYSIDLFCADVDLKEALEKTEENGAFEGMIVNTIIGIWIIIQSNVWKTYRDIKRYRKMDSKEYWKCLYWWKRKKIKLLMSEWKQIAKEQTVAADMAPENI